MERCGHRVKRGARVAAFHARRRPE